VEREGRVPRAVRPANEPTPVPRERQEQVRGPGERAGEVGDACIYRYDTVEIQAQRGGVGEIAQFGAEVPQAGACGEGRLVGRADGRLEAHKLGVEREQRREGRERQGAALLRLSFGSDCRNPGFSL